MNLRTQLQQLVGKNLQLDHGVYDFTYTLTVTDSYEYGGREVCDRILEVGDDAIVVVKYDIATGQSDKWVEIYPISHLVRIGHPSA
jgi:hypothetical protein